MAKEQGDKFANVAFAEVTESAANTLTFSEINTGVSLFEKVAWIVHKIEWYLSLTTRGLITTSLHSLKLALTVSNKMTGLALNDPAVLDLFERSSLNLTAVGFELDNYPHIRDFSTMPGGGLIVPPKPLFVAILGEALVAVATGSMRMFFTQRRLTPDEYWELVEARRIIE